MEPPDDYGRRQCPAGCPSSAAGTADYYRGPQEQRYASEKNLHHLQQQQHAAADRFVVSSERSSSDRLPSGERYHHPSERYPLGDRPHTSISSEHLDVDRHPQYAAERYHQERRPGVGSLERYHAQTLERFQRTTTPIERYHHHQEQDLETYDPYGRCEGGTTGRQREYHDVKPKATPKLYPQTLYYADRFPAIPCPEPFAGGTTQVPYLEPPSPAPASNRFIPPPPLSPERSAIIDDDDASPECFAGNAFPSPTGVTNRLDRFVPPPPLSPSPTEAYSPKKPEKPRYHDKYLIQCFPDARQPQCCVYGTAGQYQTTNPHMPVERYVPQPQEPYYGNYQYDRFHQSSKYDPYSRRDLAFHYRVPLQYYQRLRYPNPTTTRQTTTTTIKPCCPYQQQQQQQQEAYHQHQHQRSSPGSTSSSASSKEGEIYHHQHHHHHQQLVLQEKGTQCGTQQYGKVAKGKPCRHAVCASPTVEYVGQSGGRHVCATPPPRIAASGEGAGAVAAAASAVVVCGEPCCAAARKGSGGSVWRQSSTPQPPLQQQQTPSATTNGTPTTTATEPPTTKDQQPLLQQQQLTETKTTTSPSEVVQQKPPSVQRTISLPATMTERYRQPRDLPQHQQPQPRVDYTQSERIGRDRPKFARSTSRKEAIKKYIRKETASFFGVDEENEEDQRQRWLDRRKRLACRTCGPLKEEYRTPSFRTLRRTVSEAPGKTSSMLPMQALSAGRPDVLPGPSDAVDSHDQIVSPGLAGLRGKDSVARMTWDGLSYVVSTLTRHGPRQRDQRARWSRSFPPDTPADSPSYDDEVFFDRVSQQPTPRTPEDDVDAFREVGRYSRSTEPEETLPMRASSPPPPPPQQQLQPTVMMRPVHGWKRAQKEETSRPAGVGCSRIFSSMLDRVLDNSDRRVYGMGWVGKMFGRSVRRSVVQDEDILNQLDDMEDHRPLFTYWVTTVQILVLIISLFCYGFGPFGIDLQSRSGQVLVTSLSLQQVDYLEPANFWFGPRAADLIHLGAKFGPCMRVDNKIIKQIAKTQEKERDTACCIRNDDSGCVQSSQADCSKTISTWKKWSVGESGPGGRISGSVCGLDPKFCDAPASVHPYEWPDDITKWPICRKTNMQFSVQRNGTRDKLTAEHMVCEVIGHPCCIGIHGQCRITTREYCDFVRGTFHEEASLCSQVSCLNDVCGMIPFYFPQTPDQFYRLWTSLFLHAGILQLAITVLVQYYLMRDLEKLTGSLRIGIIYVGSGVAGNLASAIFVPYRADVGPAGAQFGLLACLIVEVLNAWPMLKHPNQALCKLLTITVVLFCVGLLPWVDNYAHLFGFVFGFLLSYALLPFVSFGSYERRKKIVLIWVCLMAAGVLFVCLVLLFYFIPVYDCKWCGYFNCLPITADFCASQNINFKREVPVV